MLPVYFLILGCRVALQNEWFCGLVQAHNNACIHASTAAECNVANSDEGAGLACACNTGYGGTITWDGATLSGTCTRTQCTGSYADAPAGGAVTKSDGDNHGSEATFSCDDGFTFNGANPITCDAASADADWPAPNTTPQCTRKLFVRVKTSAYPKGSL